MLKETKSMIAARFRGGMLSMDDLFDLKVFITGIERDERRKKIEALQDERENRKV